ncbi:MAG TPA: DUF2800 domain-containing protein [Polyangiaceae bacterium]
MRHHRLSASGLSRGRHCLHWARVDITWPPEEPDSYTRYGTAGHGVIDKTIETGDLCDPLEFADALDDADTAKLEATYETWWKWWQTARGSLRWRTELRVAWNVVTGEARLLPRTGTHRDYGDLSPDEVPGTADVVGDDAEHLSVHDWKWGYRAVEDPTSNPQLAFLGGAIATQMGRDEAEVTIVKPGEHAMWVAQPHTLDAMSFAATRAEVRGMLERIPTAEPRPGPWCDYCPARGSCRATAEQVSEVVDAAAIVRRHPVSLEITSNDHAAWMLTAIDGVEEFIKSARAKLRAYADKEGGITLADGSLWGGHPVHTERPDLDAPGALQAIYSLGLTEAIESKTTWAALKRAGGPKGEKAAREKLAQLGAIKSSDHVRYEAKPAKKGRAA